MVIWIFFSVLYQKIFTSQQLTKNVIFIADHTVERFFLYLLIKEDFTGLFLGRTSKKSKLIPEYCILGSYYLQFLLIVDSILLQWIVSSIYSRIKNPSKLVLCASFILNVLDVLI